ncbi:MAG: hypothetical protein JWN56_1835 [Sphingobacteriales bacterium]|nr:hypothetical protein [Sphingobacteriales bacterium]
MKKLLLPFLILISIETFGCSCGTTPFLIKYQRSEFIATAKILKVVQDDKNEDYHDIEIELINVYKGIPINKLKIESALNSSCSFLPPENTTWLIFASKDRKGFLSFGFCSGCEQIDLQFDLVKYSNLNTKYKNSIELKLEALRYLSRSKVSSVNRFSLLTNDYAICSDGLKGFKEKNRFAIYELKVNQDLTISKIKTIKRFNNKELSKKLTSCLENNLKINVNKVKTIQEKTNLVVIYFYYLADEKNPSFITIWDL